MEGHTENICALAIGKDDTIISGSWDKSISLMSRTAKIWKDGKCISNLTGHAYAVWGVLELENGLTATGSADQTIILWNQGKQSKVLKGHTDVVRTLVSIPTLGFASCSNDGTIRLWDNNGASLYALHGHTSFVYSIAVLPTGELVSSGEDRSARVWNGTNETQVITLPCISVWSVGALTNGDIIVGGSDSIIRVFTRDYERLATTDELEVYQSSLASAKVPANQVGDLDTKKLGGAEELIVPGKKEGEVKMLKIDGKVSAYQWSAAESTWIEIGEVTDAIGSNRKQVYQGKEYDYVFDVDVREGAPPLKLPFNNSEDPYHAAQKFIDTNELPQDYLDQIANFIITNAQNIVLGETPVPRSDPWGRGGESSSIVPDENRKSPLIPQREYVKQKTIKTAPVLQKIKQLNENFGGSELMLSPNELDTLEKIANAIESNGIKSSIGGAEWNVLSKLCYSWPVDKCFPGLDLLRIIVSESDYPLVHHADFFNSFERFFNVSKSPEQVVLTNAMLVCRVLSNSFAQANAVENLYQASIKVLYTLI